MAWMRKAPRPGRGKGKANWWPELQRREQAITLSPRQKDVLTAWWINEPIQDTMARLGIGVDAVYLHRRMARHKMGNAKNMVTAVKRALKQRLIGDRPTNMGQ